MAKMSKRVRVAIVAIEAGRCHGDPYGTVAVFDHPADIRGLADAVAKAWSVTIHRKPTLLVVVPIQVSSQADNPYGAV